MESTSSSGKFIKMINTGHKVHNCVTQVASFIFKICLFGLSVRGSAALGNFEHHCPEPESQNNWRHFSDYELYKTLGKEA